MTTMHVIPVPYGMTALEAYEEIAVFGEILDFDPENPRFQEPLLTWATVRVDEEEED